MYGRLILAHTVRCCCETKYLAWAVWHQCLLCMFRQSVMLSAATSCSQCSISGRLRTILSYTVLCVTCMAGNQLSKCMSRMRQLYAAVCKASLCLQSKQLLAMPGQSWQMAGRRGLLAAISPSRITMVMHVWAVIQTPLTLQRST